MYKCLVIEDEKIIRRWLRYGFDYSRYGCLVVDEAENGQEGIEKIRQIKPDIVITDITMPKKNAFEMLEVTKDQLFSTIIISGYDDFSNAKNAIQFGVTEFIVKPIDEAQLGQALKKAIKNLEAQKLLLSSVCAIEQIDEQLTSYSITEATDTSVKKMIEYIEKNYQTKFVFADVASALGYGHSILYKKFKEETNVTFNEYLITYRIQQAIKMIKTDRYKLYEIPEQVGFSDYHYFGKVFKKYTGYSPKALTALNLKQPS